MKIKLFSIIAILMLGPTIIYSQKAAKYELKSPDGILKVQIETGASISWSLKHAGQAIIEPSSIALKLESGEILGSNTSGSKGHAEEIRSKIIPLNYKKASIPDEYNQLTINFKGDFSLIFRVYNEGAAYRFVTKRKGELIIKEEEANFNFTGDQNAFLPIMWDYRGGKKFNHSFEALYHEINISKLPDDSLAFLPVLIDAGQGKKAVILEADLEDYPGMYLDKNKSGNGLTAVFAAYPLEAERGGYANMNLIPTKRADYIARTSGTRSFPWRVIVVSKSDKELLNNDMVQKLASPPRLTDVSWIKPGQVSWDWWNDWNITHVDFRAGINTATYKYYIDFAAANKLSYIIMDEGWSEIMDLTKINPAINLKEIVDYGKQKEVNVILWASWNTIRQQMDKVFPYYSQMGIKGFKIDFFDRDDQLAVASTYEIAKKAAEFHLMVDYHGIFKPTGLQRTYPNVIGYEGVKGAENLKWAMEDAPRYALSIPFIRMISGPMDYTPGAMRNATRSTFRPVGSAPMSQGTRCQQMAMYVIYEAPLQMLSDNPTIYMKEQECTDFISKIPTIYDETVALDGKVGEYAAIARKKGDSWFAAAMTDWTARELTLDFSFLEKGKYEAIIFSDGINADRDATDYRKEVRQISSGDTITIKLAPGGGWVARIEKVKGNE